MINDKNVVIYGRSVPHCSYCENMKRLLKEKNIRYTYKDISDEESYIEFCEYRLRTVPAVFIDGSFIGGFTEISELLQEEK